MKNPEKILVNKAALGRLLRALNGPVHLINELRVIHGLSLSGLGQGDNADCIGKLKEDLLRSENAAPSNVEWLPIKDAPRDGTELMLAHICEDGEIDEIDMGRWEYIETSDWDGMRVYDWATNRGMLDDPTHYVMPLRVPEKKDEDH